MCEQTLIIEQVLHASSAGTILVCPDGTVVQNTAARRLWGWSDKAIRDEDLLVSALARTSASSYDVHQCFFQKPVSERAVSERLCRIICEDGTRKFLSVMPPAIFEDGSRLVSFADATPRQGLMSEALAKSKQLRTLFASAKGFAVFRARVVDRERRGVGLSVEAEVVSPSASTLLGLPADAPFETWFEHVHPDDQEPLLAASLRARTERGPFEVRLRHWHKEHDTWRWLHAVAHPELDPEGTPTHFNGLIIDVTEQVEAEEARSALASRLADAERLEASGRLSGGIAHDFNNLLAVMRSCSAFLRDQPEDQQELLDDLDDAVTRAIALTRQLMDYARAGASKRDAVSLASLLAEVASAFRRVRPHVALLVEPGASAHVLGDPTQLHRVVLNLLLNSGDAVGEGERVFLGWELKELHGVEQAVITVRDEGCGIPEEVREHIFEPFFTTKPGSKGTGLGLPSAVGVVGAHGGRLELESDVGVGTKIEVILPLHKPEGLAEPSLVTCERDVLLIEGESPLRKMITGILEARGLTVHAFAGGDEALEWVQQNAALFNEPWIVFLDVKLHKVNGLELVRTLRETAPQLRAIFCSGFIPPEVASAIEAMPLTASMHKPFDTSTLLDAIQSLC